MSKIIGGEIICYIDTYDDTYLCKFNKITLRNKSNASLKKSIGKQTILNFQRKKTFLVETFPIFALLL